MDEVRLAAIQAWVESNGDAKGVLAAEIDTEAFLLAQVGVLRADNQRLRDENDKLRGVTRCICGPDSTGEAPDLRPDCPVHGVDAGTNRWPTEVPF